MHRIMADLMSKDFEVVTRPTEENYTMHVPEGNSSNSGNSGAQAVFSRLYDKQQLTAKVVTAGPFIPFYEFKHYFGAAVMKPSTYPTGVRYTIEPSYLLDVDGTEVVDALNPLGGEEAYSIGRWRHIAYGQANGGGNYRVVNHPKIAPLAMAKNAEADGGYVAIAAWIERYDSNHIWFSLLSNKRRPQAAVGVDWPYVWGEPFEPTQFSAGLSSYTTSGGVVDLVEFDDGSIFMVTTVDDGDSTYQSLLCYRSFDYGVTWTYCGKIASVYYSLDDHAVSIERINERLVVVYTTNTASTVTAKIYYSDDFGLTWTTGDTILNGITSDAKQCADLVMGRDKVLYLAINSSTYTNDPNVTIYRTLDGSNLSAPLYIAVNFDTFGLIEDSAGGWLLIGRYLSGSAKFAYTSVHATEVFTAAGHSFVDTDKILFDSMDNETSGVNLSTIYYVRDRAGNDFKVALTSGGSVVPITFNLSGYVHEITGIYNGELAVIHNENNPYTDSWSEMSLDPVTADYKFLTARSIAGTRVIWSDVAAAAIDNHTFIDIFAIRRDMVAAATVQARSAISEMKLGMWSGITPDYRSALDGMSSIWDLTWFANFYPNTNNPEPNIHWWDYYLSGGGESATLTDDTAANRSYIRFVVPQSDYYWYQQTTVTPKMRETGFQARFSVRVVGGQAILEVCATNTASDEVQFWLIIDEPTNSVYLYDDATNTDVATFTATNWSVTDWNIYHVILLDDEVAVYRATDQYAEILNFEQIISYDGLTPTAGTQVIRWGVSSTAAHDKVAGSTVDYEFMMVSVNGMSWTSLPVDQDADLIGRRAYYYPTGLYAGMSLKFDGTYGVADDTWTVETGAIHEMENIFNPSPSVCWKSSAYASDPLGTEPDEVMTWKQKDSDGQMFQTVTGFAVFNRNWPYCKLEGSVNGSSWTTIFDSSANADLAYAQKFTHGNPGVGSYYNQAIVTAAAGQSMHVNQYASTPEISYYLMATEGDEKFRVYRILENDETRFYLDTQLALGIDQGEDFIVFSDRFYYDFSIRSVESGIWGDVPGGTTFTPRQYRYFRLTVYGSLSGDNIIFPSAHDGLKQIGSVHLGRIYDLPNEEWSVGISLQPIMATNESRPGRKEYRRLGASRRSISLSYTGVVERGLGINPVVDLNRALGWGEYPLVFIDDADILRYGDGGSPTYGKYTHPNPILARMVDGYQLTRAAMIYESENNGDANLDLTRSIVDVSGIRLEEVV
jgi:hypothetical protein